MDEPITADLVLQVVNSTVASHWRRPEDPWRKVCIQCTDTGCPQLDWAADHLMRVREGALDGQL
jgi:hypothetical protein